MCAVFPSKDKKNDDDDEELKRVSSLISSFNYTHFRHLIERKKNIETTQVMLSKKSVWF
jgi:hypothetical protein